MSARGRVSWWRLWSVQGSFAPDARQWLGWIVALRGARGPEPGADWIDDEPRVLNTNPHMFGVLVGARVGIDEDPDAPPELARTITEVLPSTLGALGDRLIWTGIRPALVAVAAVLAPWIGVAAALGAWIVFAVGQAWFRAWSFGWARRHGAAVAVEIRRLPLHRIADVARNVGAVAVGLLTGPWIVEAVAAEERGIGVGALAVGIAGALTAWRRKDPLWVLLAVGLVSWWLTRPLGGLG